MTAKDVRLVRQSDETLVNAKLLSDLSGSDLTMIDRAWSQTRVAIHQRLLTGNVSRAAWPQSIHWDWSSKAAHLALLEASGFGVLRDESWEGAMLTKAGSYFAQLPADRGRPLLYVDYLETAPWNLHIPALAQIGRYKGVGVVLLSAAVERSFGEGFHGRVGLHALPQSESFYGQKCGMTLLGRDPEKQDLSYYEFSREGAKRFRDGGAI